MKSRKLSRIRASAIALFSAVCMLVAFTPSANAATRSSVNVHQACINQYGGSVAGTTHGSSATSWQCILRLSPVTVVYRSVDINSYYCKLYQLGSAHWDINRWDAWYCQ